MHYSPQDESDDGRNGSDGGGGGGGRDDRGGRVRWDRSMWIQTRLYTCSPRFSQLPCLCLAHDQSGLIIRAHISSHCDWPRR